MTRVDFSKSRSKHAFAMRALLRALAFFTFACNPPLQPITVTTDHARALALEEGRRDLIALLNAADLRRDERVAKLFERVRAQEVLVPSVVASLVLRMAALRIGEVKSIACRGNDLEHDGSSDLVLQWAVLASEIVEEHKEVGSLADVASSHGFTCNANTGGWYCTKEDGVTRVALVIAHGFVEFTITLTRRPHSEFAISYGALASHLPWLRPPTLSKREMDGLQNLPVRCSTRTSKENEPMQSSGMTSCEPRRKHDLPPSERIRVVVIDQSAPPHGDALELQMWRYLQTLGYVSFMHETFLHYRRSENDNFSLGTISERHSVDLAWQRSLEHYSCHGDLQQ